MGCFGFISTKRRAIELGYEEKYRQPEAGMVEAKKRGKECDDRLSRLRGLMLEHKVDCYVVPSEDEHQSEYVAETDRRLAHLTSFTGSAGTCLITLSSAYLFVDSRYWIQASHQCSESYDVIHLGPAEVEGAWSSWGAWAQKNLEGSRIGIDPKLISLPQYLLLSSHLNLIPLPQNLISLLLPHPPPPPPPLLLHPLEFSGLSSAHKLHNARIALFGPASGWEKDSRVFILPTLPSICWLLNLRSDQPFPIPFSPLFHAYLTLSPSSCTLFAREGVVAGEVGAYLGGTGVRVGGYGVGEVGRAVREEMGRGEGDREKVGKGEGKRVISIPGISWALAKEVGLDELELLPACPVEAAKGIKNPIEIEGFRRAYLRDGLATIRWMAWLEREVGRSGVGEIEAGDKLTEFRSGDAYFRGLAYENISASGPNGALPHYSPEKGKDRIIDRETFYVNDSGAQYLDGTIDTTRTMHFGKPTKQQKLAFTRVLQGHIAIEITPFPAGTKADKLDILARQYLYRDGMNFGHGVGHGVASYGPVHEGPVFIGRPLELEEGMVQSNEPGYYVEGKWGVRIESVLVLKKFEPKHHPGGSWLQWGRLTRVPIQTSCVDLSLLSGDEKRWLKAHNRLVKDELMGLLGKQDGEVRKWLKRNC